MDKNCLHEKGYSSGLSENYFFTWSVPNVAFTGNMGLNSSFKMANGYSYNPILNVSKDKITFTISSVASNLKCFVSMFIGSQTLLLSNTLNKPTRSDGHPSFTKYYDLVNLSPEDENFRKLEQHPNDTLIFICKLIYLPSSFSTGSLKTLREQTLTSTDSLYNLKTLADGLKRSSESLLMEKVVLRVGEETEAVSKVVLIARSPVFAKMFENDMKESKENVITVSDIKMPVLKIVVSFMYTGKFLIDETDLAANDEFNLLCDIYYAADKYGVVELCQLCVEMLLPQISMDNIYKIMKLAFNHNDALLKSTALALIATNIDTWCSTNDWKNLIHDQPKIAAEVLDFFDY